MEKEKKRRARRTNATIDTDIMKAMKELVEEVGFSKITLTGVIQKAQIEPNVFYNRFKDLDTLFDKYTEQYNSWFMNIYESGEESEPSSTKYKNILATLTNKLFDDKSMQKLLIWELANNTGTNKRAAVNRDKSSQVFTKYFASHLQNKDVDLRIITTILIGGICYTSLRKNIATICGIDFNEGDARQELIDNLMVIVDKVCVFDDSQPDAKLLHIAKRLKRNGVDNVVIMDSTGLTSKQLSKL